MGRPYPLSLNASDCLRNEWRHPVVLVIQQRPLFYSGVGLCPSPIQQVPQCRKKFRNGILDHGPNDVVVHAQIAVRQAVSRSYDCAPGDLRMLIADCARHVGGCFANQFQVAQGGIVGDRVVRRTQFDPLLRYRLGPFQRIRSYRSHRNANPVTPIAGARHRRPSRSTYGRSSARNDFCVTRSTERPQQVLQVELGPEVSLPVCRSVETNQDVDVTVFRCLVACHGSEEDELSDSKLLQKGLPYVLGDTLRTSSLVISFSRGWVETRRSLRQLKN